MNNPDKDVQYSVIVPAFNEEEFLPGTLASLKEAMSQVDTPGEVIVVDNNSTDNTSRIATDAGARVVFEQKNQISRARNAGARNARGRYLVFLDADSRASGELLETAIRNLEGGLCCGGGAYIALDIILSARMQRIADLINFLAAKRGVAPGCFIYCLREAFEDIGGFSEKIYAAEEILFSRQLRKWGKKHGKPFCQVKAFSVITSSRKLNHPIQLLFAILFGMLLPFSIFFRPLCWYWYHKPPKKKRFEREPG